MRSRGIPLLALPFVGALVWALRSSSGAGQAPALAPPSASGSQPAPASAAASAPGAAELASARASASAPGPAASASASGPGAPCSPLLAEREEAPADPASLLYYVNRWRSIPGAYPYSATSPWTPCNGPLPARVKGVDLLCLPKGYSHRTPEALRELAWDSAADIERTHDGQEVGLRGRVGFKPMIDAGRLEGHDIRVRSGFRAFANQALVFESWVDKERKRGYPANEAVRRAAASSAQPGHSEHQLGTTADLVYCEPGKPCYEGWDAATMASSPPLRWMRDNAHRFGLVISYDEGTSRVTQYVWEPWHVRFVGARVASELRRCKVPLEAFLNERYGAGPLPAYELPAERP